MALPEPITRLEKYWAAILDKIQGGGSSVTVEPLTVTQNGTQTAPSGKAYSPVTVDVPNPNYVETISGTLAAPFGNYSFRDVTNLLRNGQVTVQLLIDGYGLSSYEGEPMTAIANAPLYSGVNFSGCDYNTTTDVWGESICVHYQRGSLVVHEYYDGTQTVDIPTNTPTTLTIIHHPLPDSE